ncbi:alpha/beta hydrolase [Bradyrhizobium sp. 40]|uniref:alpha/beta hydrolase n=1 Tax=Bradyrhizobium sp. 40 TaxID=2782674 RepID=UPI0020001FA7|nr:alpha/beta hydrolase [Bradyrhizobium sp. 40]UPJ45027.1 alpha/beta hydrolase [Bradyrhizobium sp. 40]
MVGAVPKPRADIRADRTASGARGRALRTALISALVPLSLTLVQCGKAPNPAALAANSQANVQGNVPANVQVVAKTNQQVASSDSFEDRFPAPQFRERFPSASEGFLQRQMSDFSPKRAVQQQPEQAPYKVASLAPQAPYQRPPREDLTTLVSMKWSAFPYFGNNPASDAPFLNISKGDRRGHRSYSGRVFWQDETYNDNRVLMHVPEHFDVRKPGVIVVFFHGNGATLERDVRDRQLVPQQVTDSGANAILLAPQMAVDAADSSAGKFWQAGGLKRFIDESANHLARLTGDPNSARAFANMPIVIVGYSGGFLPTAWSLEVGGISDRVRGVVLLDAVYGEMDKFASWIESHRSGFFVSSYTHYTARRDRELMSTLRQKGITVSEDMDGPLRPGSVVFVETGDGITHRDYVTRAWTRDPLKDVLVKMSATPSLALTRVASTNPSASSR